MGRELVTARGRHIRSDGGPAPAGLCRVRWRGLVVPALAHAVLVVGGVLYGAVAVVAVVTGWRPIVIETGSMEPALRPGDVVLVDRAAAPTEGDVVTAGSRRGGVGRVTHRVTDVTPDGLVTKGDANAGVDAGTVPFGAVLGVGRVVVPMVGLPGTWWRSGDHAPVVVSAAAVAVLIVARRPLGRRRPRHLRAPSTPALVLRGSASVVAAVVLTGSAAAVTAWPTDAAFAHEVTDPGNSWGARTLAAPSGLSATAYCDLGIFGPSVVTSWTGVPGATGYQVQRATNVAGPWTLVGAPAVQSLEDTTVVALTTYHYRVRATVGTWTGTFSATASASTGLCL